MTEWNIQRFSGAWTDEDDCDDITITLSVDRFARSAVAHITPSDGRDIAADYPVFSPVRVRYDDGAGDVVKLVGFVASVVSGQDGADIEILSGDYFLRRQEVYLSVVASPIATILQTLVETYSALEWDAAEVDVVNNINVTREWRGERLDKVISELATLSASEVFGATDALKFFFRPRDLTPCAVAFDDANIIEASRETDQKEAVDKVYVYYTPIAGKSAVSVGNYADGAAHQALTGTIRPIIRTASYDHPEITDIDVAIEKARQYLDKAAPLDVITIHTMEYPEISPGEIASVTSSDLSIVGGAYVIYEITWQWSTQDVQIKLIENRDGVVDFLNALQTEKVRVDMKEAAATIVPVENVALVQPIRIAITKVEAYLPTVDGDAFRAGYFGPGIGYTGVGGWLGYGITGWTKVLDETPI